MNHKLKKVNIKISDMYICICSDNQYINDYIIKEFKNSVVKEKDKNIDTCMNIEVFVHEEHCFKIKEKVNDNIFKDKDGKVLQIIKGKRRKSFVIYDKNFSNIKIYIPYKVSDSNVKKIFNPKFLNKFENSLLDFFQGPFIGIMEYLLVKKDNTFIHGSACSYNDFGYVFCGKAQVGKTEIANSILDKAQIISDDFTILCNNSSIVPYQKSVGVFWDNINIKKYFKNKKKSEIFWQKINIFLFKLLKITGIKLKRVLFFTELFENSYSKENIKLENIYYLERSNEEYSLKQMERKVFIEEMVDILENEFNNLQNFWVLLKVCVCLDKEEFLERINKCLDKCLQKEKCFVVNIPYFKTKSEFRYQVKGIISNALDIEEEV